ncbi:hypothetical protein AYI69_g1212 [Smittium culicis]|uniref:Uncharacterized protein n=1 Tax=Smittium culicis TaxID=133412 RepID=A0A1R1YR13_9FUNG|nr:hypothetical protein AYI69_g1212 [Smittium culicis]
MHLIEFTGGTVELYKFFTLAGFVVCVVYLLNRELVYKIFGFNPDEIPRSMRNGSKFNDLGLSELNLSVLTKELKVMVIKINLFRK